MSGSTGIYIRALNISAGSLAELSGDVDDCFEDKLITKGEFSEADSLIRRTDYLLKRLIRSLRAKNKKIEKKKV